MRHLKYILATMIVSSIDGSANSQESWVGKSVVFTKPSAKVNFWVEQGKQRTSVVFQGCLPIEVRNDRAGELLIFDGKREGWVKKSDFVLLGNALEYFGRQRRVTPGDVFVSFMLGNVRLLNKDFDNGIKEFDELLRVNPNFVPALRCRSIGWISKKEYDKAIRDCDDALRIDPLDAVAFGNRALARYGKNQFDKSVEDFDQAIHLDPKCGHFFTGRGESRLKNEQLDLAMEDFNEAIRLNSRDHLAFNGRSAIWSSKGELGKAQKDLDEALRLESKHALSYQMRGQLWLHKREYDKALADLDEAVRLAPEFSDALADRGTAWYHKKDYDKAIRDMNEALRIDPASPIHANRGNVWFAKKDYHKAILDYDEAIQRAPHNSKAQYARAVVLFVTHQAEAGKGFQKVLDCEKWNGHWSPNSVILGYFAFCRAGDSVSAKQLLDAAAKNMKAGTWPNPMIKYLVKSIDETTLLRQASDQMHMSEAQCWLGLNCLLKNQEKQAREHFLWVKANSTPGSNAYCIAISELTRIEHNSPPPKP